MRATTTIMTAMECLLCGFIECLGMLFIGMPFFKHGLRINQI